jgi:hypothetical protein
MTIKAIYTNQDEIPETYRGLFEERGGAFHLTKIEGIKTDADVARVQRALDAEKGEKVKIKTQWDGFFGERKPEDVQAMLDKYPELEALANGKLDDEKINSIVEGRLKTKISPIERERDQFKTRLSEADQRIALYESKEKQRTIHDAVRQVAVKMKVLDTAQEDVLMLAERMFEINQDGTVTAKDGVGVTPGVAPEIWLTEMQQKRPHWWPASVGGGAKGSGAGGGFAENPWSAEYWNLTAQGQVITSLGQTKAEQMAKAVGSRIGGTRPIAKK